MLYVVGGSRVATCFGSTTKTGLLSVFRHGVNKVRGVQVRGISRSTTKYTYDYLYLA